MKIQRSDHSGIKYVGTRLTTYFSREVLSRPGSTITEVNVSQCRTYLTHIERSLRGRSPPELCRCLALHALWADTSLRARLEADESMNPGNQRRKGDSQC